MKTLRKVSLTIRAALVIAVMGTSPRAARDATQDTQDSLDKFTIEASADWIQRGHPGAFGGLAPAVSTLAERKLPMRFTWVACQPNCRGWVSAVGIVTADTPNEFDEFARGRQLGGATIVLDSSGGSVNDAIALGRRWHNLGVLTTVGASIDANGDHTDIAPQAYCESMCVFLLLSGKVRYVPDGAHVRVHQIWMADSADDAKAASYSAHDIMIVERDIGRLAKYAFDMGGGGDLLSLALSVPPWEDLHELSPAELRLTNLVTTDAVAEVLSPNDRAAAADDASPKPVQGGFVGEAVSAERPFSAAKSTKIAEATAPTGSIAAAHPAQPVEPPLENRKTECRQLSRASKGGAT
jgi:hypothetical protein